MHHANYLHELVPGAHLTVLPHRGQMPPYTAPEAVVEAIERAITQSGTPGND